uniref:Peptidyl-prolyl cis-trans isomerase n=1 Tax=Aureoumbra lagunensis TaxID=44058 RepID=A0A7S3JVA9_9STRA|mmetsp:Transcript_690/g.875  ORF Transcript_690/g.875 Transcript_690/m.875 type:complete len:216 (+) Transcript_690:81-728(+)|eukprot:CAMPEP_0197285840 /NCGR_PEP_ID=MMETSP0890-20130614/1174_1 /TAXON_ID=44058 ORGANISM="Aureoumbra lagunensis, Strain CCMP1510" /NCGR_SAMPLE_ID=MMETSP0890 /ASSEMBLY_ACC=CAM_ASM_000533 /LENGTH=215 /DNA_ID=CAMNT_0042753681 /DNA_START=58 /DNA_END=705 /DNA_ORIENTATION=+
MLGRISTVALATIGSASALQRRTMMAMATNPIARFKTSKGNFDVELYVDKLPITASNFKDLASTGFYDGLTFHRVIKNFMCQFGCPHSNPEKQTGMPGTGGPKPGTSFELPDGTTITRNAGGNIPDELIEPISNSPGTISMANTGAPDSGGSQIFINTNNNKFLDYFDSSSPSAHPVFGKVVEGMDIVKSIEAVRTDGRDMPIEPVVVETIEIVE